MGNESKRVGACFDGPWNTDKSNTNVSRLFRRIADETTGCDEQRHFYDEGVGTRWGERVGGGVFGIGLHLATDGDAPALDVDDVLHHVLEARHQPPEFRGIDGPIE